MVKCFSSGDLGDVILSLPILKHLGGGDYIVGSRPFTRFITWFDTIAPLVRAQPYVQDFRWEVPGEEFTHDMSTFRPPKKCCTLTNLMGEHVKVWPVDVTSPWLTVKPTLNGRVVIHRSERYRSDLFPWQRVVDFYGDRLLMVGLPHEHKQFQDSFGKVEFYKIKDYLDLAQMIAGSFLFIGNQSSPHAIAQGLKHPLIQETCGWTPDCVFPHPRAQYCFDGTLTLPNDKGAPLVIAHKPKRLRDRNGGVPGGYVFTRDGKTFTGANFASCLARARVRFPELTEDELDAHIAATLSHPFVNATHADFSLIQHAYKLAGIPWPL